MISYSDNELVDHIVVTSTNPVELRLANIILDLQRDIGNIPYQFYLDHGHGTIASAVDEMQYTIENLTRELDESRNTIATLEERVEQLQMMTLVEILDGMAKKVLQAERAHRLAEETIGRLEDKLAAAKEQLDSWSTLIRD